VKRIGFLSFGHWTPAHHAEVHIAADAHFPGMAIPRLGPVAWEEP